MSSIADIGKFYGQILYPNFSPSKPEESFS